MCVIISSPAKSSFSAWWECQRVESSDVLITRTSVMAGGYAIKFSSILFHVPFARGFYTGIIWSLCLECNSCLPAYENLEFEPSQVLWHATA